MLLQGSAARKFNTATLSDINTALGAHSNTQHKAKLFLLRGTHSNTQHATLSEVVFAKGYTQQQSMPPFLVVKLQHIKKLAKTLAHKA